MLMFVGEDLDVLSIASRKEEAAWDAPAIAKVITGKEIQESGAKTISEAVDGTAGFHVEPTNKGSIPYLRGISNSALVLFDTIPILSGTEKSDHLMDYETSLASIKRIEIIRGAGSVLWGPDAFAGVVNAVPLTGKDFSGLETGLGMSSSDQEKQAFIRYGKNYNDWSSFLSLSARESKDSEKALDVIRFWNDGISPSPLTERFGSDASDNSHYLELYGNIGFSDWLVISAKLSDSKKAFSMTDWNSLHSWEEDKLYNTKLFKLEAKKDIGIDSNIRLVGYYSDINLEKSFIDKQFSQNENTLFGELIYERSLFSSNALLTMGASYKEDRYDDILVWNSFFPGYLGSDNLYFLPDYTQNDYKNSLFSVFSQYRHKINDIEFWVGVRNDDHERFKDEISFSSGVSWALSSEFMVKTSYGSGYRTPFAKQLNENAGHLLEQIKNMNFQLQYKPDKRNLFSITAFRNDINDHVVGDRYEGAGISLPNSQTIKGLELEWEFEATDNLSFIGNTTFLNNDGPDEVFLFNDYTYFDENGNPQKHYQRLSHGYDAGSDTMFNLRGVWKITKDIRLIPQIKYFSDRELYYSVNNEIRRYPDEWLCNLRLHMANVKFYDIELYVNNILDNKFETFDTWHENTKNGISAGFLVKYKW